MILAIDAGNTRLKWGWREGARWEALQSLEVATLTVAAVASQANPFAGALKPSRIVVSNVAGPLVRERLLAWIAPFGVAPTWLTASRECCGVTNLYDTAEQLGADRWAALIGARALHPGDCLVVCAGTATTADLLNARGEFLGGLILPGVDLMKSALYRSTHGLPLAQGEMRAAPRNTMDAIESGCRHAQAGAIERMRRELPAQAGCLVSGGAGQSLAAALPFAARYVENLVLEGLAVVAASEPLPA